MHFSLIQPSDLLLVDHDGNILDESGPNRLLNTAAFMIHSAVHSARPDVLCAAHSHSIYGRAFATLGIELDMLTQDSCAFYKVRGMKKDHTQNAISILQDHAVYKQFNGLVLEAEEGTRIAEALGHRKVRCLYL